MAAPRILPPYEVLRELYLAGETPHEIASKYRVGVRAVRHAVTRGARQTGLPAPQEAKRTHSTRLRDGPLVNKMLVKGEIIDFIRGYGHTRAETMLLLGVDLPQFEKIIDFIRGYGHTRAETMLLLGVDLPQFEKIMDEETTFVPRSLVEKIVNRVMAYEAVHGEPVDYYAASAA